MGFMKFDRMGIFEQDGERVGLIPLEITTNWGENPILRAEVLSFFNESNALRRNKTNPEIKKVIFNDPATVVIWSDDSKTVVKCQPGDTYDAEKGLALCISKKFLGNKGNFNEVFKKWIPEEPIETISVKDMIEGLYAFCEKVTTCAGCIFERDDSCNFDELSEEELKRLYKKLIKKGRFRR